MTEIFVKNEVDGSLRDTLESVDDINDIDVVEMQSVSTVKKKSLFKKIKDLKESRVPLSMLQNLPLPPRPIPSNPTISVKAAASEASLPATAPAPESAASDPTKQVASKQQANS